MRRRESDRDFDSDHTLAHPTPTWLLLQSSMIAATFHPGSFFDRLEEAKRQSVVGVRFVLAFVLMHASWSMQCIAHCTRLLFLECPRLRVVVPDRVGVRELHVCAEGVE